MRYKVAKSKKWEMLSIENFVEQLMEEERTTFTRPEIIELAESLNLQTLQVAVKLEAYGLKGDPTQRDEKEVRTFSSNSNNLWSHPSMQCGGGGGGNVLNGFVESRGCSRTAK